MEEWKHMLGYEKHYMISNEGRLRSLDRYQKNKLTKTFSLFKGKALKLHKGKSYLHYSFSLNRKKKTLLIHRIVAINFIPNPENKPCVNHKDGDKFNNKVDNLEWVTYSENERHSYNVLGKKIFGYWKGKKISPELIKIRSDGWKKTEYANRGKK